MGSNNTKLHIKSELYKEGKGLILTGVTIICDTVVTFVLLVYTCNIFYLLIT